MAAAMFCANVTRTVSAKDLRLVAGIPEAQGGDRGISLAKEEHFQNVSRPQQIQILKVA
jgi:hypothetical protein